ncbi:MULTISPECIES: DUF2782 domain-containing protein [Acidithiobacillus]|jgi:hypothetical protein|uniref:Uncharacterized protein n=3 Tax=Acidithiobacillus ferridurans TaxID=1232575 RepID=A0A2Z6II76_ACIFI|nr:MULTISPECIES: DUF2782 domain-containing protein [Acidithiobacillus]MBU2716977.1 DUF2782 domain-containing protein [Acidithiobacillus ferridurans]MBU2719050.1 DUF2782 domain-containing protein [Acidithiobacillus ferridurans]MBU2722553.1 DUF2782 domain-containing protein [Acidithiobacillus ferridurans]MBU2733863.1 DUF2782 domain-containing protein [Acidithiobacillus ferridurans]MBU2806470.1 DUF2782 domain-containing protein [Acidithiobacillus ferridurans]
MSIRIFVLVVGTCFALGASLSTWAADNLQKLHLPTLAPEAKTGPKAEIKVPKGSRIEEYKVNGKVYMVKVIPPKPFPPYYLEDKGGTGRFTEVPQTAAEHLSVPHWVIFRW